MESFTEETWTGHTPGGDVPKKTQKEFEDHSYLDMFRGETLLVICRLSDSVQKGL